MPHLHPQPPFKVPAYPLSFITTAAAACSAFICRASLWDSHLITLPRVHVLHVLVSLKLMAVRSSVEQVSAVVIPE
jgi:hypothetical protein